MNITELEQQVREGERSKRCLEDLHELKVFERVESYLNSRELSCDPDNTKQAQRLVISRQILASIEREFAKLVKNGEYAKIRIKEIEQTRSPIDRVFSRGY